MTTSETSRRRYCIDDSMAICYHSEEKNELDQKIECLFSEFHVFNNRQLMIDFIRTIKTDRIILILSDDIDRDSMKSFDELKQIVFISTFVQTKSFKDETNSKKFVGNFHSLDDLCQVTRERKRQMENSRMKVTISKLNENEIDPALIYSELLKDILLDFRYTDDDKNNFAEFAKSQYLNNRATQTMIERFRHDPNYSPIRWYTCESFLYSMLNGALRNQDLDVIHKLGFFIRDLHERICQLQDNAPPQSSMTLYRGQGLNRKDFQRIQSIPNCIISFHHFLSTSRCESVARIRAESTAESEELVGILFQMTIDPQVSDVPFASIDNESAFGSEEAEILFSINSIFRIGQIEPLGSNLYRIYLTLIRHDDPEMQQLIQYLREEIQVNDSPLHRFGQLTLRMQEWTKAKEIYQNLLDKYLENRHTEGTAHSYHQLGYIHFQLNDFDVAIDYLQKSLEILQRYRNFYLPAIADTYSLIGEIFFEQKQNLQTALEYMKKALAIRLKQYEPEPQTLAKNYAQIGETLLYLKQHDEALINLNKALELQLGSLPNYHMDLASTYSTISHVYHDIGKYEEGLNYCEKALSIYKRCLRHNHPSLATVHTNMANNLGELKRFDEGIVHVKEAIEISHLFLPSDHGDLKGRERILHALESNKRYHENPPDNH